MERGPLHVAIPSGKWHRLMRPRSRLAAPRNPQGFRWRLHRVWCTAWTRGPKTEIERVLEQARTDLPEHPPATDCEEPDKPPYCAF